VVAPPWAKDAAGENVKTHYQLNGSVLTQTVEHQAPGVAYPVLADPWLGVDLIDHFQW